MRSKTEYIVQEEMNARGKTVSVPKKVGLAPQMREGIDFEFSTVLEIGMDHNASASKDRTGLFVDKTFRIDENTGERIAGWQGRSPSKRKRLRTLRKKAKLTVGELSVKSGIPLKTLYKWESASCAPAIDRFPDLARAMRVKTCTSTEYKRQSKAGIERSGTAAPLSRYSGAKSLKEHDHRKPLLFPQ